MKVAIPVFHTKISPRFDQTQAFVLLDIHQSEVIARKNLATRGWSEIDKMRRLVKLGIETVICGGIDRASLQYLSFNGVHVYSWVTGEVDDAVACFLDNRMKPGIILGEHGEMMGRWQFCKGRNHLSNMFQTGFYNGKEGVNSMPNGSGRGSCRQGQGTGMGRGAGKAGKGGRGGRRNSGCRNTGGRSQRSPKDSTTEPQIPRGQSQRATED
jgi:predicted Fe-Mo cluster-binding NifX family protein